MPVDIEGRVLEEIIDPAFLDARPREFSETGAVTVGGVQNYAAEDLDEVEGRLRNLGYLE